MGHQKVANRKKTPHCCCKRSFFEFARVNWIKMQQPAHAPRELVSKWLGRGCQSICKGGTEQLITLFTNNFIDVQIKWEGSSRSSSSDLKTRPPAAGRRYPRRPIRMDEFLGGSEAASLCSVGTRHSLAR